MPESEIGTYIRLLRQWIFVIAFSILGFALLGFIIHTLQEPVYQSESIISIGGYIRSPDPEFSEVQTGLELAQTYIELVKTYTVLQATIETLDLPYTVETLADEVNVGVRNGTSLIEVRVRDADPILASTIANEITRQLILNSPSNLTPQQESQIELSEAQIELLNSQLQEIRIELELINDELNSVTDEVEIERLTEQRNGLLVQINQLSATIAQFSATIANLQERTNSIDIIEEARIPIETANLNIFLFVTVSGLIGFVVAIIAIVLFEHFDHSIRTVQDVAQWLALPVLGGIMRFGNKPSERILTPDSTHLVTEGYRAIRTNVMIDKRQKQRFLITSPAPAEGKTISAANLAITMAIADIKVLLIDADLRRPKLHDLFKVSNEIGVSTLLQDGREPSDFNENEILSWIRETDISNLYLLPSGNTPTNPTELLGSVQMPLWIETLQEITEADVILIDTPPCVPFSDAIVLAATTKANTLLVIDSGKTHQNMAQKAKAQFEQVGLKIDGVILNKINPYSEPYYGYAYYRTYSNYGTTNVPFLQRMRQRIFPK